MLSVSDNELMCRVGPGTPMGNMIREYWIPVLTPDDLVPDGPPLRIRLLGENLIAFRATNGDHGLIQNACPHRGASMFFGRNEEDGLRCVYHGWKFDTNGTCVDMPSEPAESNFKNKVRTRAYPCVERNGVIWTYMGTRTEPPPLPGLPPNLDPTCTVLRRMQECNYMQALEGDIDTVHAGFLHLGHLDADRDFLRGGPEYYGIKQREARFEQYDHEIGATYAAVRPAEEGAEYWRTGHYLLPFWTMNAPGVMPIKNSCTAWVPLDDEHTLIWNIGPRNQRGMGPETVGIGGLHAGAFLTGEPQSPTDPYPKRVPGQPLGTLGRMYAPDTSDWLGRFRAIANASNDYYIDRELQANMEKDPTKPLRGTYTGVPQVAQDPLAQESMGALYDRSQEHLGTSDGMMIKARRKLLNAVKAHRDAGVMPPGVDSPQLYRMRSGGAILPAGIDGMEALRPVHFFESNEPNLPLEVAVPTS
jgi:nitrite reductase/ring-hydroxylating ferredoxin subunit